MSADDTKPVPDHVHLVGIGGAGMSAIAHYLLDLGVTVSGSDSIVSVTTERLAARGARVFHEHGLADLRGVQLVVVSDAIPPGNPDVATARSGGIEILKRAAFLQRLGRGKTSVQVTGSHGKSTTSAMIATVLKDAGSDPSFVLGAVAPGLHDRSGKASTGEHLVVEACEAFRSLPCYQADYAVITNIDDDHIEHYGSQAALDAAFVAFANRVSVAGRVFVNGDDSGVRRLLGEMPGGYVTFGFADSNRIIADRVCEYRGGSRFHVTFDGKALGFVELKFPGRHMIQNALACISVCLTLGISFGTISASLAGFAGVSRRWRDLGSIGGVRIVEDFAHHPGALEAVVETARGLVTEHGRLIVGFQPQLYSRTARLARSYARVLEEVGDVLLLDIDPGGERNRAGISNQDILAHIDGAKAAVHLSASPEAMAQHALSIAAGGDVVLLAGGADIGRVASMIARKLAGGSGSGCNCRQLLSAARGPEPEQAPGLPLNALTLISRWFSETPFADAVAFGNETITYRELDIISAQLARALVDHGVHKGDVVAIGLPPSIDQVAMQIAVLRLGATCLALDANLPARRLDYMLEAADAVATITCEGSGLDTCLKGSAKIPLEAMIAGRLGKDRHEPEADVSPHCPAQGRDIAHICFTSGTTGRPKGVPTSHQALATLTGAVLDRFRLSRTTRTALNSSLNFDASIAEIMLTLSAGGTLCIPTAQRPLMGRELRDFILENEVTHLFATPSVLATLPWSRLPTLEVIVAGGEVCSQDLADRLASICGAFFNAYGPSEAAIYSTAWAYSENEQVCIGAPLDHLSLHILDHQQETVPVGEIGEIYLSGAGVCDGYIGDPDQYRDRFVEIGVQGGRAATAYRTGDLARFRADGQVEFVGRADTQVKVRGNRIELEEIEAALCRLERVRDAIVCVEQSETRCDIVAYYTGAEGVDEDPASFAEILAGWLPKYMLPTSIVRVDQIPFTLTGKKDRLEASRRFRHKTFPPVAFVPPADETQARLAGLWQHILGTDHPVGQTHLFDSLGGDSLKHVTLAMAVEDTFGVTVPPGYFGRISDLKSMAGQIDELRALSADGHSAQHGFLNDELLGKQREFVSTWTGRRHDANALIVTEGAVDAEHNLFWCLQSGFELTQLAKALGKDFQVHGMRSGHRIMSYTKENLAALSEHYAWEIDRINPDGPLYFGGNCQGGQVAHAVAEILKAKGREIRLLILMEQARFPKYSGRLAFIYGQDSFLNPLTRYSDGLSQYDHAYPQGYSMDLIPGLHGQYFMAPNVIALADKISVAVKRSKT